MSELPVPNDQHDTKGHLELVGKNPSNTEEHEATVSLVLFHFEDSSMSDAVIAKAVSDSIKDHFTMEQFRNHDGDDLPKYILRSIMADVHIIADDETYDELLELDEAQLTRDERSVLHTTAFIRGGWLDKAVKRIEKADVTPDKKIDFRNYLEDYMDEKGLYASNVMRALTLLKKSLPGYQDDILIAMRYMKTMMLPPEELTAELNQP